MIDLKAIRKARGITQQQLADEVHCVRTAIANIECGIAQPSVALAKAIGNALDFEWWHFFNEECVADGTDSLHGAGSCETSEN